MSEMSDMFKLVNQMELAKKARVGMSLTYFDVIELLGELDSLKTCIAELESAQRWRVVADGEMPEDRATILAAFKNREILTATYYKRYEGFGGVENYWHIEGWHSGEVTHWMPLPELPEVQQ